MRKPTLSQLSRVNDYAVAFADYAEKSSVAKIGSSQFDDFELFE